MVAPLKDRGVSGLFTDLARDTSLLIRQEVALAKAEFTEQVAQLATGAVTLVAGGRLLFAGFLALLAAAVLGLALVLPPWRAAVAGGVLVMLVGLGLVIAGRRALVAHGLLPQGTMRRLRRSVERTKEHVG